jgi:hypothetical protein
MTSATDHCSFRRDDSVRKKAILKQVTNLAGSTAICRLKFDVF